MTPEEIKENNDRSLKILVRTLQKEEGNFVLIGACCNSTLFQREVIQKIEKEFRISIHKYFLPKESETLYSNLIDFRDKKGLSSGKKSDFAISIFGLESVARLEDLLVASNHVRDNFRTSFKFPLILWLNDDLLDKLRKIAPDFNNHITWISFKSEDFFITNERSLKTLSRVLTLSIGEFSLILLRCNYRRLQKFILGYLRQDNAALFQELFLSESTTSLYAAIGQKLEFESEMSVPLMILGLESVIDIDRFLISANQVREEFRKRYQLPLVFWINDLVLQKLSRLAPDLNAWAAIPIKFEMSLEGLIEFLQDLTSDLVPSALDAVDEVFPIYQFRIPNSISINLSELEFALEDVRALNYSLEPKLDANINFFMAQSARLKGEAEISREYYEQSLAFWQKQIEQGSTSTNDVIFCACIQFHLGLWWRQYAIHRPLEQNAACLQAKAYYQQCIEQLFGQNRPDLVGKFINALGEVLARLELWDELATVAQQAVQLHQINPEPIRLAYAYGLLAEVALQQQAWTTVKAQSELALQTNELSSPSVIDWSLDRAQRKNFYLFLLAQAQRHLKQDLQAIKNLETAKANFQSQYDPTLHLQILEALRSLYFEHGQYLQAFATKQEQRSIEQQYGLRAFIGAGRLQPQRIVVNPDPGAMKRSTSISQEIAASGRMQDVERLLERLGRADHKLTVIYGPSGVGKSSLVQAGLVPILKQTSIEVRDVVPVLVQVYTDWMKSLGYQLTESLQEVTGWRLPLLLDSSAALMAAIHESESNNLSLVLIFDQLEEFFFVYKDPIQRRPFFEFLRTCLNTLYVKIIFSLREDYLHYLLEFSRVTDIPAIGNDILNKNILYYLGNFSSEDAKSVIHTLTRNSQVYLQPELIDALVQDLAGSIGEVRPIELQVVGAQLQSEGITTLTEYRTLGPKEALVGRFLEAVVADCGVANENFAKIILYLLTDENNTRPLKTRAELAADLALPPERLELILKILVASGLVFQFLEVPTERYQLVHDYLVPFIRQQQSATLVAELEKEREQRKLTEAKLNQALKNQLKIARRVTLILSAMTFLAIILTVVALYLFNLQQTELKAAQQRIEELQRLIQKLHK